MVARKFETMKTDRHAVLKVDEVTGEELIILDKKAESFCNSFINDEECIGSVQKAYCKAFGLDYLQKISNGSMQRAAYDLYKNPAIKKQLKLMLENKGFNTDKANAKLLDLIDSPDNKTSLGALKLYYDINGLIKKPDININTQNNFNFDNLSDEELDKLINVQQSILKNNNNE